MFTNQFDKNTGEIDDSNDVNSNVYVKKLQPKYIDFN